jgi:phage N-6-adenine-methyltransferase
MMSERQDWGTPQSFIDWLEGAFEELTLDAAASDTNHKAPKWFTAEQNGLDQSWANEVVWVNPPFGKGGASLSSWAAKCAKERKRAKAIFLLIPARTETRYWHDSIFPFAHRIYFIKGRFQFVHDDACGGANAPFPSALIEYRPNRQLYWRRQMVPLELTPKIRGF